MGRYYDSYWPPYVPVAERRRRAAKKVAKMRKAGKKVSPVEIDGRKIARTFWGDAWCRNLEAYSDYSNRLPRGRTYVRNGSVIDLQIEAGRVRALVSGTDLYTVDIRIKPLPKKKWTGIKKQCAGQIDSLVELLQGSISKGVMEIVTRKGAGLFPSPREIALSCSCPDWAAMCKHVAATLYGVGARLDREPGLLFTLRGVDPAEMVEAAIDQPAGASKASRGRVLEADDLSSVFGVDIDTDGVSPRAKRSTASVSRAVLERLFTRTTDLVEDSPLLSELLDTVQMARGRIYLWRGEEDAMARITPLDARTVVLESPRGRRWSERERGPLATVLTSLENDTSGVFHGLGSLLVEEADAPPSAQLVLHLDYNIPVPVLAEPRRWYAQRQEPVIAEGADARDRVLVRFVADGASGPSHGTCLYALEDGEWGCYTIAPDVSETIAAAEEWLDERGWEGWD